MEQLLEARIADSHVRRDWRDGPRFFAAGVDTEVSFSQRVHFRDFRVVNPAGKGYDSGKVLPELLTLFRSALDLDVHSRGRIQHPSPDTQSRCKPVHRGPTPDALENARENDMVPNPRARNAVGAIHDSRPEEFCTTESNPFRGQREGQGRRGPKGFGIVPGCAVSGSTGRWIDLPAPGQAGIRARVTTPPNRTENSRDVAQFGITFWDFKANLII